MFYKRETKDNETFTIYYDNETYTIELVCVGFTLTRNATMEDAEMTLKNWLTVPNLSFGMKSLKHLYNIKNC